MSDEPRDLPDHLRALLDGTDPELSNRLGKVLDGTRSKLTKGRFGRAVKLSRLAVGTGGRALVSKAKETLSKTSEDDKNKSAQDAALQMVATLAEMRGVAMKMGQMLSYLEETMPPEARKVLAVLQRDAPPMPYEDVKARIEEELGESPETLFDEFETTAMAAASIGQVHRAKLKDGTAVAVKVQYPGIADAMRADLKNARMMSLFQRVFFFRTDTKAIMAELEERLIDECDYRKEAKYQKEFRARFDGHPWIVVPEVHDEFSTEFVLTTTLEHGRTFYEWLADDPSPEERQRTTELFYRFYLGSFYMDGLFNCDPHPGNYLFRDDGKVVFLDYGCTRSFEDARRRLWTEVCLAVHRDERPELERLATAVGFIPEGVEYDYDAFRDLMRYLYMAYLEDAPFEFSRHPPADTFRRMFVDNPNLFKMNMPADAVFLNRITFGLVSLLAQIDGKLNCYRTSSAYFEGRDPHWPEDPRRVAQASS